MDDGSARDRRHPLGARRVEVRASGLPLLAVVLACATVAAPAVAQDETAEPLPAVWQSRDLFFTYSSSTAIFSCAALAGRVATILRSVGARDDVRVRATNCDESHVPVSRPTTPADRSIGFEPSPTERFRSPAAAPRQMSNVAVSVMLPTEVTPEIMAELHKDKSRRELLSRVTGNPVTRFDDPIPFTARRKAITISRKTLGVIPEECELLEQMSTTVLRQMGVRTLRGTGRCSPGSRLPPELHVEALVPTTHVLPGETPPAPPRDPAPEDVAPETAPPSAQAPSTEEPPEGT